MTIEAGQQLLHYRLTEKIGEGGMGVVWSAEDTVLRRSVALKFLPEGFDRDAGRLSRFEREARFLASLSHPNIASIFGLEQADGERFLIMELAPGESLADRLNKKKPSVEESLKLGCEIAKALEAAHEKGVIHRDLKPGNVQVTPKGQVKVLDFGLAKAFSAVSSASEMAAQPTMTAAATGQNVVMGTTSYMSPEQASGQQLDKRTDIWAFGCVLYEMLTGQRAFLGDTVSSTLAAIQRQDPDWERLPVETPAAIHRLLHRCLDKNPDRRLHDIADARIEIEDALAAQEWTGASGTVESARPVARPPWQLVAFLAGATVVGAASYALLSPLFSTGSNTETRPTAGPTRLSIVTRGDPRGSAMISPNGSTVVYTLPAQEEGGPKRLYKHPLNTYEPVAVQGYQGGSVWATFSPDGSWIAYVDRVESQFAALRLMKVRVNGNTPPEVVLADWPNEWTRNTQVWLPDGDIVTTTSGGGNQSIIRIPTDGSEPRSPVEIDHGGLLDMQVLDALPDGRNVLTALRSRKMGATYDVGLLNVDTGKARLLIEDGIPARWSSTGHIVFARSDTLFAAPFDLGNLGTTGVPVAIMSGLWVHGSGISWFDLSANGTLVYRPGGPEQFLKRLVLVDPDGNVEAWSEDQRRFEGLNVSPDGRRVVTSVNIPGSAGELWVSEFDRPGLRRFARGSYPQLPGPALQAVWSPDGENLVWAEFDVLASDPPIHIVMQRTDGGERRLLFEYSESDEEDWYAFAPMSVSPDGSWLLLSRQLGKTYDVSLLALKPVTQERGEPRTLFSTGNGFYRASFFPDGRWIAYGSNTTGSRAICIRRFGEDGSVGPEVVVAIGNYDPHGWSRSPKADHVELLYYNTATPHILMAVSIRTRPTLAILEPRVFFTLPEQGFDFDRASLLPDGRVLAVQDSEEAAPTSQINVVQNFDQELKRKLADAQ